VSDDLKIEDETPGVLLSVDVTDDRSLSDVHGVTDNDGRSSKPPIFESGFSQFLTRVTLGGSGPVRSGPPRVNLRAILVIVIAVVLANCSYTILGNVANPIWWTTNVSSHVCNWYCGPPTTDPNVGFLTQPLGHLAALDLLHGHIPWWNYFEGLGQPLAGEMQSAALFPLVLLFALPSGLLLFHLALQMIAGISTYLLVRRLGVGAVIATLGGILFALNGTYAWIGNAVVNPICFLPLMILGIEMTLDERRANQRVGLTVTAIAMALSIYAGFPETAYLDGLLVIGWAVTRLVSLPKIQRMWGLVRICVAGAFGIGLSLPVLVPFLDFLHVANVGDHADKLLSTSTTAVSSLPLLVNPYAGGAILGGSLTTPYNVLGYFTASVAVFAISGLTGRRLRHLRWFLAGWLVAVTAGVLNLLGLRYGWNLLPEMDSVAFARYIWPTSEFAVIILAVLGLSDIVEHGASRKLARWSALIVAVIALAGVALLTSSDGHEKGSLEFVLIFLVVLPFIALVILGFAFQFLSGRAFFTTVVAVMAMESLLFFAVPEFRSPATVDVANGSISYLQQHEGLNRFISLGVLNPNWGSQFSLNEINAIDLPLPKSFSDYIATNLAPSAKNSRIFTLPFTPTSQDDIAAHIANYEALGVAYILTPPEPLDPTLSALGLTLVAHDAHSDLYRIATSTNFYSTALATCVITNATVDHLKVTCPSPTILTRLELSMAGWSAHVNGTPVPITSDNGLTQSVAIPAGTSTVSFDYLPPHEDLAALGAIVALVAMATMWLPRRVLRRARRRRDDDFAAVDEHMD